MRIEFDRRARLDIEGIAKWLEGQSRGLGEDFITETEKLVSSIESNPSQFGPYPGTKYEQEVRVAVYPTFKAYILIYRIISQSELVQIAEVRHGHRRAGHWSSRFKTFQTGES